jgi:hypothetical protein
MQISHDMQMARQDKKRIKQMNEVRRIASAAGI